MPPHHALLYAHRGECRVAVRRGRSRSNLPIDFHKVSMSQPSTSGSLVSTLAAGTRLGAYEILQPIGAGGMGEVYRALDTRLRREVAIKTVSINHQSNPEALL